MNSNLDEVVYCEYPKGFEQDGYCLLLLWAFYGLCQSPLLWLKELLHALTDLGFHQILEEPCLFTDNRLIIFFYIDDIVILCHSKDILQLQTFQETIMDQYEMQDLGELTWFLGIRVIWDRIHQKLWLCQDSYIKKITKVFHLKDLKPLKTPMKSKELYPSNGKAIL